MTQQGFSGSFVEVDKIVEISQAVGKAGHSLNPRITSIYQPTNAHTISHKTLLEHFKTLRLVSILLDHHQGALSLTKVILQYSQFNSYLQTRCCGNISCCVGICCGAVARCASYDAHLATAPQHIPTLLHT